MQTDTSLAEAFCRDSIASLEEGCSKITHCLRQLGEDQIWWRPRPEMNSIGNLLLHLAGNVRQWIVAGVGDFEDTRERQAEFDERGPLPQDVVWGRLEQVVKEASAVLHAVSATDLMTSKQVQGFDVTKLGATMHSVSHFQGHVQEIIGLTRQQLGDEYQFRWTPDQE